MVFKILLANLMILLPIASWAQDADNEELNIIELELEKSTPKKQVQREESGNKQESANSRGEFSELGGLAPFSEVSVIQKRFMPKTNRIQFFGGVSLTTNDPFYNTTGLAFKTSYFLSETWGAEFSYYNLSSSETKSTKELLEIQSVGTDSLSYTKQYMGLTLMYVPIYGKMTLFNRHIIPFDLYFGIGAGSTKTQAKDSAATIQFTTGQLFAVTKSFGLRWDFTWNFFSAKAVNEEGTINNLILSLGASYFIPEAKYR